MKIFIYRQLYTLIWIVFSPLILLRLWLKGTRSPEYRHRWLERLGVQNIESVDVWIHAVSVGETHAAESLVRLFQQQGKKVLITSTTPTGSQSVRRLFGEDVEHCYLPWDIPLLLRPLMRKANAQVLIIMETELWPNLIFQAARHKVPVAVANARLSQRSTKGYLRLGSFVKSMLEQVDLVLAQDQDTYSNFLSLGVPADNMVTCGSVKYDVTVSEQEKEKGLALKNEWQAGKILCIASTHDDEEKRLSAVLKPLLLDRQIDVLLVPRHPDRAPDIKSSLEASSIPYTQRSIGEAPVPGKVYLADTIGEMLAFYAASDFVVMGGTFVDVGGHNFLEPAALSLPIISGPQVYNFQYVVDQLQQQKAIQQIHDEGQLPSIIQNWLANPVLPQELGCNANAWLQTQRGSLQKQYQLISELMT